VLNCVSPAATMRDGILIDVLGVARVPSVPSSVVSRSLDVIGGLPAAYLIERNVFPSLFELIWSRPKNYSLYSATARSITAELSQQVRAV
jgi:hypothetical protein